MIGQSLSHYKILEKIGQGGMGVLYKARDTHLDRMVAIKVLRPETILDPERKRRFVLEAKAASALNHPGIVTIYDVDSAAGVDFISMEYVEGQSLDRLIAGRMLPVKEALDYGVKIAGALAAAHRAGIVHRDIKPPNIMVTPAGQIKILDFGLAKLSEAPVGEDAATLTLEKQTRHGVILGTLAYMSPEQAEGKQINARSDVFSLGVLLYEMLAGKRPFHGDSSLATLAAILHESPEPLRDLRDDITAKFEQIILRCLEKKRESRHASADELFQELREFQSHLAPGRFGAAMAFAAVLIGVVALAAWYGIRESRMRWARGVALPEIARLIEKEHFLAASRLVREAERYVPAAAELERLRVQPISIRTTPPGAEVYLRDYLDVGQDQAGWELLGRSPLPDVPIPRGTFRCRILKQGFDPLEMTLASPSATPFQYTLQPLGSAPPGMVLVTSSGAASVAVYSFPAVPPVPLKDFWIDRYEVTNRQFKEFIDRGGYQNRQYWKQPFVKDGRTLSWEEAMAAFRDATGRPGPAGWELGTHPVKSSDLPVGGVSWYEAAAYAEFAGKSLPTVYHWYRAAGVGAFSGILLISNFGGSGPGPAGSFQGLGPYGTYDMAGNMKEWCWNLSGDRRYILGGAWNEGAHLFAIPDARRPFERSPSHGFRCAKYPDSLPEALSGPATFVSRDRRNERPADDAVFQVYRDLHNYDRTALKAAVESVDDGSEYWRREKITFEAAYGNERVTAYLFLPKTASPPYQTVIYFPGAGALTLQTSENPEFPLFDFIVRGGRAVLCPIYKGTYERGPSAYYHRSGQPNLWREMNLQWSKDLGRSIDYLETRPDIDRSRLAFEGHSLGAAMGPRLIAVEPRFKTGLLLQGGFFEKVPPEVDALHFAPRVKIPILMINGRDDFLFPLENSQTPLFRLLGTPEKEKRHVLVASGHVITPLQTAIKEVLDWLDRYLGPVKAPHRP